MVGTQKIKKNVSKITRAFRCCPRDKISKTRIFLIKMIVFLLQFFICNYWTAVPYMARKNSLN